MTTRTASPPEVRSASCPLSTLETAARECVRDAVGELRANTSGDIAELIERWLSSIPADWIPPKA